MMILMVTFCHWPFSFCAARNDERLTRRLNVQQPDSLLFCPKMVNQEKKLANGWCCHQEVKEEKDIWWWCTSIRVQSHITAALGRGGGTVTNDVEIQKSSRVTMQAFWECGFVQTYCNNRSLHVNIYTFKHGLKTFFIQILLYLFA